MIQESQEDATKEQAGEEGHQMMHVTFSQGGELPDDRAYLDGCSTVTTFKNKKFLENLRQVKGGIKIRSGVNRCQGRLWRDERVVPSQWNCQYLLNA